MSLDDLQRAVTEKRDLVWLRGKHPGDRIRPVKVGATMVEYTVPGRAHGRSSMHRHQLRIDFVLTCAEVAS